MSRTEQLVLATLLAVSAVIRIQQYTAGRALWTDEAMLALSVAIRSPLELLEPLYYSQVAPPVFLWSESLAVLIGGVNEASLRIVPFVAGLLVPYLVWHVGERLFNRTSTMIAVALAGFAPAMVFYSNEAKPYGVDALVTVGLVLLALPALERPNEQSVWTKLLLAGVVSIWASASAVFVLAGISGALAADSTIAPSRRVRRLGAGALAWGGAFAAAYLTVYRKGIDDPYMRDFWQDTYLKIQSPDELAHSLVLVLRSLLWIFLGESSVLASFAGVVGVALFLLVALLGPLLIGVGRVGRDHGWIGVSMLAGPSLAMTAASLNGTYPIAGRLVVFQVPLWCLLIGYGYDWIASRVFVSYSRITAGVLTASVVVAGLPVTGRWTVRQMQWSSSRELIAFEEASNRDGEPVYVTARGAPTCA
ncbi:MAG: glycosyltransferase family 39 protein, partial [Gemmatimonadales bacterium]|nr:glycosyltransferase family 39 protein [Gemmatimonadales bacterium]